jgi:hypothetical protein
MLVRGVGQGASAVRIAAQAGLQVAFSIAMYVLPELLKEIVAGSVTDNIHGPDVGDAGTSGAGEMFGTLANEGGNGALSKEDAVKFNTAYTTVAANYSKDEAAGLSPLDASNKYTFIGSMAYQILPRLYQTGQSFGDILSGVGSVMSSAFSGLLPTTNALSTAQYEASLEMCNDYDYVRLHAATTPFCNVIYGIPPEYLDKDPMKVVDELVAKNELDAESGQPKGDYKDFIKDCIQGTATKPLGSDISTDSEGDDGTKCIFSDANANYYLHFVDERVDEGLDGYHEGSGIGGSKQEIAKQIVALEEEGKITELHQEVCNGGGCMAIIHDIADGKIDGNSEPCGMNINIMKIILVAAQNFNIMINDVNRQCAGVTSHDENSNHYAGNGSAIDIGRVNSEISTGATDSDMALVQKLVDEGIIIPGTRFEQKDCRAARGFTLAQKINNLPDGVTEFAFTSCSIRHMHLDVPTTSDPDLIHGNATND